MKKQGNLNSRKDSTMNSTNETLIGILKENTGTNFLDSGGTPRYDDNGNYLGSSCGYGRNYERNQIRSFDDEVEVALEFKTWNNSLEIDFTLNTYHWLKERCELAEELNELFHGVFLEECDHDNKGWLELMEMFPEWLSLFL
jgi:hypothetical protein